MEENRYCYVCGFDLSKDQDKFVKFGTTCPCCLFEYGIDDSLYRIDGFMSYRNDWYNSGLKFMGKISYENWSLAEAYKQLDNLKHVVLSQYFSLQIIEENRNWTSEYDKEQIKRYWQSVRD